MPGTFTIDFQDRTRASIIYEAVAPRSGEAWTEMLYHVTFCVGRALVNLDREDQIEFARQFDSWLDNDFADFPVHVGPPACLTPCARFVSSFDGTVPSYVRGAYGFGLNARGLDYYGPMVAGVLMHHIRDAWDRPDDLLRPAQTLCLRVVTDGVDEAGHVQLVTECVAEALAEFKHRKKAASPEQALLKEEALPGKGSAWRRAVAGAGIVLGLGVAVAWHLSQEPVPSSQPVRSSEVAEVEPKAVMEARKAEDQRKAEEQRVAVLSSEAEKQEARLAELKRLEEAVRRAAAEQAEVARKEADERVRQAELARKKAEEERKTEEQRVAALGLEAEKKEARLAELRRLEEAARRAESERRRAAEEQAEVARKEADERVRQAELARKKAEEERKAGEQRVAEAKRQQEENERQRLAEAARKKAEEERKAGEQRLAEVKRQQEALAPKPAPPPSPEKTIVGRDGLPMVLVSSGEFLMGNQAEEDAPPHRVYLDAFYIDRHEVTNGRYLKFVESTRHRAPQHVVDPQYDLWAGTTLSQGVADLPVVNVDWFDAAAYCRWAGKRLPTEAEWEKAARGTDSRLYPWGNEAPSLARLNFSRRWQGAHTLQPVGNYEAGNSPYGAQDMAGNVWEWVGDWYDAGSYAAGPARNPQGPSSGSSKILRGGSWTNSADSVRATHRREEDPDMRNSDSGFRCARGAN